MPVSLSLFLISVMLDHPLVSPFHVSARLRSPHDSRYVHGVHTHCSYYPPSKPLCLELARSAAEVVQVGSEVERLREEVNSLQKLKEEEEEEEEEAGEMDVGGLVISNVDALGE